MAGSGRAPASSIEVTLDPEIEGVDITATDSNDLADQVAFTDGLDPPEVAIDPDQVTEIDEFDSVVVMATFELGSSSDGMAGFDLTVPQRRSDATAGATVDVNGVPTVVSKVGEEVPFSSVAVRAIEHEEAVIASGPGPRRRRSGRAAGGRGGRRRVWACRDPQDDAAAPVGDRQAGRWWSSVREAVARCWRSAASVRKWRIVRSCSSL